ncbi:hypothetical protein FQN60_010297 [Etheostoma spectabile]|uniref:Uncharacterized protein n=1 Tax=Etheostoma spectabile TaxID=54343 RepID=A0A5J5D2K5_9PERO|nr:hypothetical protein FQN60_004522 [Etheostoma spectabile]KAA8588952.1 hypothetical protein FQN60_010297 [Etheostoma spectabile]
MEREKSEQQDNRRKKGIALPKQETYDPDSKGKVQQRNITERCVGGTENTDDVMVPCASVDH